MLVALYRHFSLHSGIYFSFVFVDNRFFLFFVLLLFVFFLFCYVLELKIGLLICCFCFWKILLPTVVMLLLIAVRMQVDNTVHPPQPWVLKITYNFSILLFFGVHFGRLCSVSQYMVVERVFVSAKFHASHSKCFYGYPHCIINCGRQGPSVISFGSFEDALLLYNSPKWIIFQTASF